MSSPENLRHTLTSATLDSVYSRHVLLKLTQTRQHMTGLSNKGKHAINTARDHVTGIVQMNWYRTYSGRGAPWCFHSQAARGRCMGHGNHYYLTPTRRSHSPRVRCHSNHRPRRLLPDLATTVIRRGQRGFNRRKQEQGTKKLSTWGTMELWAGLKGSI